MGGYVLRINLLYQKSILYLPGGAGGNDLLATNFSETLRAKAGIPDDGKILSRRSVFHLYCRRVWFVGGCLKTLPDTG